MLLLSGCWLLAAPLAADEASQPASIAPKDGGESGFDLATALEPDECLCCEKTQAAMTRYCAEQMPMGDLKMEHFDCQKEMGMEITFNSESSHQRWSAVKSCKCDCDRRLEELRKTDCPMACKQLPFACPVCAPPPPPPSPPPPIWDRKHECKPVDKTCCEATLNSLEKFCYSFAPKGDAVKIEDPTHWDKGVWQPPASFDELCERYPPRECVAVGPQACSRMMQLIARQFHPDVCDAIRTCGGFCDHQCPSNSSASHVIQEALDSIKPAQQQQVVQQQQQQQVQHVQVQQQEAAVKEQLQAPSLQKIEQWRAVQQEEAEANRQRVTAAQWQSDLDKMAAAGAAAPAASEYW